MQPVESCAACQQPLVDEHDRIGVKRTKRAYHLDCFTCPHESGVVTILEGVPGKMEERHGCLLCTMLDLAKWQRDNRRTEAAPDAD